METSQTKAISDALTNAPQLIVSTAVITTTVVATKLCLDVGSVLMHRYLTKVANRSNKE